MTSSSQVEGGISLEEMGHLQPSNVFFWGGEKEIRVSSDIDAFIDMGGGGGGSSPLE